MLALSTEHLRPLLQVRQVVAFGADVTIPDEVPSERQISITSLTKHFVGSLICRVVGGAIDLVSQERRMLFCGE